MAAGELSTELCEEEGAPGVPLPPRMALLFNKFLLAKETRYEHRCTHHSFQKHVGCLSWLEGGPKAGKPAYGSKPGLFSF